MNCSPSGFLEVDAETLETSLPRVYAGGDLRDPGPSVGSAIIKRVIDICVSVVALIVLSPLMAIIAIAIKLDSPGPVFFWQEYQSSVCRIGIGR